MRSQPHPSGNASEFLSSTARYGWLAVAAMVIASVVSGCTGLPTGVDRPVSSALASPDETPLGQLVQAQRAAAGARHLSGFLLLSGPQAAYGSRLALVESAQKTLDLQYYAIHADASTERLLLGVVAAAQRGVRVRVLLDDFHSAGRDAQVMRLAFVPNIEMRMFNPLTGARGSTLGRMFSALGDFSRVQQRMHNKLFIADNAMGVTGGRNLGDAYFGSAESGNFVDLDVLAAGPVVQELSRSFDSYWNNERAYPVQSLVTREELDRMRSRARTAGEAQRGRVDAPSSPQAPDDSPPKEPGTPPQDAPASQRARIWDQRPMDLTQATFTWAPAAVLVDKPAKIPPDSTSSAVLPEKPPAKASPLAITSRGGSAPPRLPSGATARPPSPPSGPSPAAAPDAPGTVAPPPNYRPDAQTLDAQTDTVVDGLLQLMGKARRELLIVSPYFVPGPDMKQAFADATSRGVRVRVLTNSLASNDAPIAHAGYARHRPDLLGMGVELYEMRSELPSGLRGALGSSGSTGGEGGSGGLGSGSMGSSRSMLHSKLLIVDGRLLVVGSMNLDIRSQRQNTEIALLIRSTDLSRRATEQIETALREAAWKVQRTESGLVWQAPEGSGLPNSTTEPDASVPLRLMLQLLGPLAPDHLL
ncbi:phospholipase D family protein [Acidovorax sp.]|uniref:phospholipase D family protein n=1 Tax=Acidovorax sp. TaxID=1872122 RepID=UPI0025BB21BF|nr:phospholipase D family protein [Acidovorax sp.]MCI5070363.1 phospholipase D-like domain-containing protein [Acidovorax sp.]